MDHMDNIINNSNNNNNNSRHSSVRSGGSSTMKNLSLIPKNELSLNEYFEAISLFRRKRYEKCVDLCNNILLIQNNGNNSMRNSSIEKHRQQIYDGVWQLKMRALTQRVYVDDLEANDDGLENEEVEFERIATAARPGTSIKTAFVPRPTSSLISSGTGRPKTLTARPITGIARPGTSSSRPGSSISSRPASRCGTARRVRVTSATAYNMGDPTSALFQASRLNPTIYAERRTIIKSLFQFLFYHEGDPQKALSLCETVAEVQNQKVDWWWEQQRARCLIALNHSRRAEKYLKSSLGSFPHPDTYLLMCKMYMKLDLPQPALQLVTAALDRSPYDISLRIQQARIYELLNLMPESIKSYREIAQLDPINMEAIASIAVHHFYDNQPEMALMYYRRILSVGVHSAELFCNLGLCCLYGGQLDLVLHCFHRALRLAATPEQKADIWYNLSFVALTTGDFNLAKRCLRLCLISDAANAAALNNLAVLSAQAGDFAKAKSYLKAAQATTLESPEIENNARILDRL